jgi:hypothetical protein
MPLTQNIKLRVRPTSIPNVTCLTSKFRWWLLSKPTAKCRFHPTSFYSLTPVKRVTDNNFRITLIYSCTENVFKSRNSTTTDAYVAPISQCYPHQWKTLTHELFQADMHSIRAQCRQQEHIYLPMFHSRQKLRTRHSTTPVLPKVCSSHPKWSATSSQGIRGYNSVKATLKFTYSELKK